MTDLERRAGDPPSPFEEQYAFSRVTCVGEWVLVGGTTAIDEYGVVQGDTPYEQARVVIEKILRELARVGVGAEGVVQNRIYVTDISRAEDVGRAHADAFGAVRPLMTLVEVSGLIDPRMLVEIETVARRG